MRDTNIPTRTQTDTDTDKHTDRLIDTDGHRLTQTDIYGQIRTQTDTNISTRTQTDADIDKHTDRAQTDTDYRRQIPTDTDTNEQRPVFNRPELLEWFDGEEVRDLPDTGPEQVPGLGV